MPKGPHGEKRPADPNQLAKLVIEIATGEISEPEKTALEKRARAGGAKGGPARSAALTPEQRAKIAKAAATVRWKKSD